MPRFPIPQEPDQFNLPVLPEVYGNMETSAPLSVPLQLAQNLEPDYFAGLDMTYPAQEAFSKYITEQPNRDQYQPSKLRRILAGAGGFSAGWQQGPQAGIGLAQGIIDTPYHQALENWKLGLAPRQHAAQIEATSAGQQYTNAYRRARLQQLGEKDVAKQKSAAYTGQWLPTSFYNNKTHTLRNVENNRKLGLWRDPVTLESVPGQGPDEEPRQRSFGTFNQVSNQEGVPTQTMSIVDRQRMAAKDPTAFTKSNEPVAEPGTLAVDKLGQAAGMVGNVTGIAKPIMPAAPPGQTPPKLADLRRTAMSSGELSQRAGIDIMRNDFNTLKANMPEIMKQLVGPRKSAVARMKASNYNVLGEFWDAAKPTALQAAALTAEKSLQNAIIRREEGANIPQWIWNALEKTLPISSQPPEVYTQNFERFEKVLKMLEDQRNLTDPGRFDLQFSKIMTPPTTPQTKLKWKRQKATGVIFMMDPTTGARPIREGEIKDDALEVK